jgi:hypothetical protein
MLSVFSDIRRHCPNFIPFSEQLISDWALKDIASAESRYYSRNILLNAIRNTKDEEIIVLNQFCPWREMLVNSSAKFVIYPSSRGGYNMHTIPQTRAGTKAKLDFPQRWCRGDLGNAQSDVPGIVFVHKGNYLITCKTLSDCYLAARIAGEDFMKHTLKERELSSLCSLLNDNKINTQDWSNETIENICTGYTRRELEQFCDALSHIYMPELLQQRKVSWAIMYIQKKIKTEDYQK